jgi:hypothetical protein
MRSYTLLDFDNRNTIGTIMCSVVPMIGSKLIYDTKYCQDHYRVKDVEYTFYEQIDTFDITLIVTREK